MKIQKKKIGGGGSGGRGLGRGRGGKGVLVGGPGGCER